MVPPCTFELTQICVLSSRDSAAAIEIPRGAVVETLL